MSPPGRPKGEDRRAQHEGTAVSPAAVARAGRPRRTQRGAGLIDAMVALAILAFGMLSMTNFQTRMIAQGTDAQTRLVAAQLGDELLSLALTDPDNAGCYTVPAGGACGSANARALTNAWAERALAGLPGEGTVTSTLAANGQLEVVLAWTGREGASDSERERELRTVTDVRP